MKIIGPMAPEAAQKPKLGPSTLAARCLADCSIIQGDCLLICGGEGEIVQRMQQGFLEMTELRITALYPNEAVVEQAQSRIRAAQQDRHISCRVGKVDSLPFAEASFERSIRPMIPS